MTIWLNNYKFIKQEFDNTYFGLQYYEERMWSSAHPLKEHSIEVIDTLRKVLLKKGHPELEPNALPDLKVYMC